MCGDAPMYGYGGYGGIVGMVPYHTTIRWMRGTLLLPPVLDL